MDNRLSNSDENSGAAGQDDVHDQRDGAACGPAEAAGRSARDHDSCLRPPYGDLGRDRSRGIDFARLAEDDRGRDGGFTREWDQTIPVVTRGPSGNLGHRGRDMTHRGKGPRDYRRSDETIREDVCERLSDDRRVDASDIEVTVSDGEITFDGTVESSYAKRRAEDTAADVSGARHVQNNLRVRPPAAE
jgi:hypothetical protein